MQDAITTTVQVYTVSIVCPLCHEPLTFEKTGVTVCPHCGKAFIIKTQPAPGPSEVKA